MGWPNRDAVAPGIVAMLHTNMGLKAGERLLVVTDLPRPEDWQEKPAAELESMLERSMLARLVADVARGAFPNCPVSFLTFAATGGSGREPDAATATRMRQADVVIALTRYSLSHTDARQAASQAGARVASMPGFQPSMLEAGGPMAVDYGQVAADSRRWAEHLSAARQAVVRTPAGTELRFNLDGRTALADHGLLTAPGDFGNLPAGEAYIAPVESTAEGRLVVPAGWYPNLAEQLTLRFEVGLVVEVLGGGAVGDELRAALDLASQAPSHLARRNLAELGVGTNPNARRPDNTLEAEKIRGTVHLAIGDNAHMGGRVSADLHRDYVQPQADLIVDGKALLLGGEWQV